MWSIDTTSIAQHCFYSIIPIICALGRWIFCVSLFGTQFLRHWVRLRTSTNRLPYSSGERFTQPVLLWDTIVYLLNCETNFLDHRHSPNCVVYDDNDSTRILDTLKVLNTLGERERFAATTLCDNLWWIFWKGWELTINHFVISIWINILQCRVIKLEMDARQCSQHHADHGKLRKNWTHGRGVPFRPHGVIRRRYHFDLRLLKCNWRNRFDWKWLQDLWFIICASISEDSTGDMRKGDTATDLLSLRVIELKLLLNILCMYGSFSIAWQ